MKIERTFETREDYRQWLENNGQTSEGVWLIFDKSKTLKTLSPEEALEEALCYGWIDGLLNSIDEYRYRKYFALRRKGSKWSEKNKGLAAKLIDNGRMTAHGLRAIEEAKKNGMWDKIQKWSISEDQQSAFESKIKVSAPAFGNYSSLPDSARKQFAGFYYDARKEETRIKRLEKIIRLLEQNKRLM
jgi:uncharacterized protein YdeI (YjbR/CyaY-like superfamily)